MTNPSKSPTDLIDATGRVWAVLLADSAGIFQPTQEFRPTLSSVNLCPPIVPQSIGEVKL